MPQLNQPVQDEPREKLVRLRRGERSKCEWSRLRWKINTAGQWAHLAESSERGGRGIEDEPKGRVDACKK